MNNIETIVEMRNTLVSLNASLTPYSSKKEHQRYLDSLLHYKKILNTFISRSLVDIDLCIDKSKRIIDGFTILDIPTIKHQILDGRS
jgi:hypothetical protein